MIGLGSCVKDKSVYNSRDLAEPARESREKGPHGRHGYTETHVPVGASAPENPRVLEDSE